MINQLLAFYSTVKSLSNWSGYVFPLLEELALVLLLLKKFNISKKVMASTSVIHLNEILDGYKKGLRTCYISVLKR